MNSEFLFYVLSIILRVCIEEGTNKLFYKSNQNIAASLNIALGNNGKLRFNY